MNSLPQWKNNPRVQGDINFWSVLQECYMEDLLVLTKESPVIYLDEIVDYHAMIHDVHILRIVLYNTNMCFQT